MVRQVTLFASFDGPAMRNVNDKVVQVEMGFLKRGLNEKSNSIQAEFFDSDFILKGFFLLLVSSHFLFGVAFAEEKDI